MTYPTKREELAYLPDIKPFKNGGLRISGPRRGK
jgi:hypothetical protein